MGWWGWARKCGTTLFAPFNPPPPGADGDGGGVSLSIIGAQGLCTVIMEASVFSDNFGGAVPLQHRLVMGTCMCV